MSQDPLISVCIPAYGRANFLPELMYSLISQDYDDFEIVVCEDHSPERPEIRGIIESFQQRSTRTIRYFENDVNLGYDANIRRLIHLANGKYVCFTGNDDLLAEGSLRRIAGAITRHPGVGVVLRTYSTFRETPDRPDQIFRWFHEERVFPAGSDTIVTFFKRCVVLPGLTFDRRAALKWDTPEFDGRLLYQIWIVANILVEGTGVYIPEVVAHYRLGGIPEFGNASSERRGNFVPNEQTVESSLFMMKGFLEIARGVETTRGVYIRRSIERDLANYSFPFISLQRSKGLRVFLRYVWDLGRLGFGKHAMYWVYAIAVTLVPIRILLIIMRTIKSILGRTPPIGQVYGGLPVR